MPFEISKLAKESPFIRRLNVPELCDFQVMPLFGPIEARAAFINDDITRSDSIDVPQLVAHMKRAELYQSVAPADGLGFRAPIDFPPHERRVEIEIDLGLGAGACAVLGADLSHEYVTENADYRS